MLELVSALIVFIIAGGLVWIVATMSRLSAVLHEDEYENDHYPGRPKQ